MFSILKNIFRLQFLFILIAIIVGVYYKEILEELKTRYLSDNLKDAIALKFNSGPTTAEKLFSKAELSTFDGENENPLYLAIIGSVYDVTKGKKHYGAGCSYNYFVGRDASVSFITGEFENYDAERADDVLTLTPSELLSLDNWKKFYDKDYTYKGKLVGRFYDATGAKTTYHHKYDALVEQARLQKAASEELRAAYPECNIEWSAEKGSRVWCTTTSGGGQAREWAGYPRKLFALGSDNFRCACIKEEDLDTTDIMIKPYDNCERLATECYYHVD